YFVFQAEDGIRVFHVTGVQTCALPIYKNTGEKVEWHYEDGLRSYLVDSVSEFLRLPDEPFVGALAGNTEAVDWALLWLPEGGDAVQESYVNLIPTAQGGTHVNGLRQGLLDAMREFCEFRSL